MLDKEITKMDFKELRGEVQRLRDDLAKMKRGYEDILYNLDDDNFSERIVKEKKGMKASITVTAEAIKTKVSQEDLKGELTKYSTIEQTAESITAIVNEEFVSGLIGDEYVSNAVFNSKIEETSRSILASVSETYETKDNANTQYSALSSQIQLTSIGIELKVEEKVTADYINDKVGDTYETKDNAEEQRGLIRDSIAAVEITADGISSTVTDVKNKQESIFVQTSDGFTMDGEQTTFTGVIYLTDDNRNKRYGIFLEEQFSDNPYIMMHGVEGDMSVIIGNSADSAVYIGNRDATDANRVATHSWVLENAGSGGAGGKVVAVFGE